MSKEIVLQIEKGFSPLGKKSRRDRKEREERPKCKSCHCRDILFSEIKKEEKTMSEDKVIIKKCLGRGRDLKKFIRIPYQKVGGKAIQRQMCTHRTRAEETKI